MPAILQCFILFNFTLVFRWVYLDSNFKYLLKHEAILWYNQAFMPDSFSGILCHSFLNDENLP
jgi:hypothetical protein